MVFVDIGCDNGVVTVATIIAVAGMDFFLVGVVE